MQNLYAPFRAKKALTASPIKGLAMKMFQSDLHPHRTVVEKPAGPGVSPKSSLFPPTTQSGSEIWAETLFLAEGDVSYAVFILADRLAVGDVPPDAVAATVDYVGLTALTEHGLLNVITALLETDNQPSRLLALQTITSLITVCGKMVEPLMLGLLPAVLGCAGDKSQANAEAALETGHTFIENFHPQATRALLGILFKAISAPSGDTWQTKTAALSLLAARCKRFPVEAGQCAVEILPVLTNAVNDTRPEVAEAAHRALSACCYAVGNKDLDPHVTDIVSCIAQPSNVPNLIEKLSSTTFVQAVESSTLAVLAPLMLRALRGRCLSTTQRGAAIIIENLSKLVADPIQARPFLSELIPALEGITNNASDPDLRSVAHRVLSVLQNIKEPCDKSKPKPSHGATAQAVQQSLCKACTAVAPSVDLTAAAPAAALRYVSMLVTSLITAHLHGPRSWQRCTVPYLSPVLEGDAAAKEVTLGLRHWALGLMGEALGSQEEDLQTELCNCEFNLAYGGRILLTNATLHLLRGRRYGLCGANGVGKSTLMRSIARGQLEGFPPKEELRPVYVEHDIDASESEISAIDWIFEDLVVQEAVHPSRDVVTDALESMRFTSELQAAPIKALSGGWKMKLALARAMVIKADILLLDEPTNHLDVGNVAWLTNYLVSMPNVASMIVSHDSSFLDDVCTDIIHFEGRHLAHYPGNLSEFVKIQPEAKSYYELSAASFKFKFPDPGFLDGIKGKSQSVMRMTNVSFKYPGADKMLLENVTLRCTMGSRIAVLGPNGAGKSTLIRLLTEEILPVEGKVWKHPNLRVAYVAQHAFHHIEEHLDETPSSYFWWRFEAGGDREAEGKITRKITEEEAAARDAAIKCGERVVDYLNSRHMGKNKEYEYEVVWVGQSSRENVWLSRTELCGKMGLSKLVEDLDAKISMFRNYRQLSTPIVLSHLHEFGLDEEIAKHTRIRGLSGGQKVKLVLAAAMWCQPHVLVLDEPTNYLDRDSLGALAGAISEFNGGVIMISHHSEFTSALCREEWRVDGTGKVTVVNRKHAAPAVQDSQVNASIETDGGVDYVVSSCFRGDGIEREGPGAGQSKDRAVQGAVRVMADQTIGRAEVEEDSMDPEELETQLRLKAERKVEKDRVAAEKAAKKAEKAKLKFAKKF